MRDFELLVGVSLLPFDHADRHRQPDLLFDLSWLEAKSFFIRLAKALGEKWLTSGDEPDARLAA